MNEQDRSIFTKLLDAPVYKQLQERFINNEFIVSIGPQDWPEGWYVDPYWRVSVPVLFDVIHKFPDANNFEIKYDRENDFHLIVFTLGDETYIVRWYKIFTLHRKSDKKHINLGRFQHRIVDCLSNKNSPEWMDYGEFCNPF